jgi:hypothetical protein
MFDTVIFHAVRAYVGYIYGFMAAFTVHNVSPFAFKPIMATDQSTSL